MVNTNCKVIYSKKGDIYTKKTNIYNKKTSVYSPLCILPDNYIFMAGEQFLFMDGIDYEFE